MLNKRRQEDEDASYILLSELVSEAETWSTMQVADLTPQVSVSVRKRTAIETMITLARDKQNWKKMQSRMKRQKWNREEELDRIMKIMRGTEKETWRKRKE